MQLLARRERGWGGGGWREGGREKIDREKEAHLHKLVKCSLISIGHGHAEHGRPEVRGQFSRSINMLLESVEI